MKEFKKIFATLMACVAVATVTSGCKNNANVDPRLAEALGIVAEAEVRNDLDKEDYDKPELVKIHLSSDVSAADEFEDLLEELEKTRKENRMLQEVLEKTRVELEDTLEKLYVARAELYAARAELE